MHYQNPMASAKREQSIRIEILSKEHDIPGFISSSEELTCYFLEDALQDTLNKTAITHVLVNSDDQIVGFFTLLNGTIKCQEIEDADRLEGYNHASTPALKIGRLSAHRDHEGEGYGTKIIALSFRYMFNILRYSGCRVMTVDSKKGCEGFYERFGFKTALKRMDDFTPMYMDIGQFTKEYENR